MFVLVTDLRAISGTTFNYGVIDTETGNCFGFNDVTKVLQLPLERAITNTDMKYFWKPVSFTTVSTEFATVAELQNSHPEFFI